jgi:hypothetical protein
MTGLIIFLISTAYFSTIAKLQINYFYQSLALMLPIQLVTIIYMSKRLVRKET